LPVCQFNGLIYLRYLLAAINNDRS